MKKIIQKTILIGVLVIITAVTPYVRSTCSSGIIIPFILPAAILGCGGEAVPPSDNSSGIKQPVKSSGEQSISNPEVTFLEFGSVNCIPCRMMQPVMEEIRKNYQGKVKVIFIDVWTSDGKKEGGEFKIRVIPTQVFLDSNGKEFFRHEGFLPYQDADKILKKKVLK